LQHAFLLWSLWNGILLIATARILSQHLFPNWNWHLLTCLSLVFVPLLLNFVQGQDSLVLLLILVLAFIAILAKREFHAGCLLACGLFKFHLVLPLVLILAFSCMRKLRFFSGFLLIAISLLAISLWMSGWGLFASYLHLLLGLQRLPLGGANPAEMANLRGLFALLFQRHSVAALVATLACSLLLLWTTIGEWRQAANADEKILALTFANSALAAVMVGYHLSPHDLTLLLLPLSLITGYVFANKNMPGWLRYWIIVSEIVIFLPPLYVLLLRRHTYAYAAIPVLILFVATHLVIKRVSPRLAAER
ncbi:MAG TPA: glycosyltransferase 87 family protein, partial [Ktedonobacteraceae bacterium]